MTCNDPRHDTPCISQDFYCIACKIECDPKYMTENRPDNFYDGNPKSDKSDATGYNEADEAMKIWEAEEADELTEDSLDSEPVDIEDLTHELGEDN